MNMKEQLDIQKMYSSGNFVAAPVVADASNVPGIDDIAVMSKTDAREWLEAHGAEIPDGATVHKLRDMLKEIMFVEETE